jgi:hypothetical protein
MWQRKQNMRTWAKQTKVTEGGWKQPAYHFGLDRMVDGGIGAGLFGYPAGVYDSTRNKVYVRACASYGITHTLCHEMIHWAQQQAMNGQAVLSRCDIIERQAEWFDGVDDSKEGPVPDEREDLALLPVQSALAMWGAILAMRRLREGRRR